MTFDDITGDKRLWAVRYDGEADNELSRLFDLWGDVMWLRNFFKENIDDLSSFFKITDVNQAVKDTIRESERLEFRLLELTPNSNLDALFRPLHDSRTADVTLGKEKASLKETIPHPSMLRLYAIKLASGTYIITGGAIKLTRTMQEREHTNLELSKMEKVRQFLLEENIIDDDGFADYLREL